MTTLVEGVPAQCCVCRVLCRSWWRGSDFYAAVHEKCLPSLVAECPVLTHRAPATAGPAVRHGAYARRAGRSPDRFAPSRFPAAHDAWFVLAETNSGQVMVPCGGNVGHGVAALRTYRLLTGRGHPIMSLASAGGFAVGAALYTPERRTAAWWGYVPVPDAPLWEPLRIVSEWSLCAECGAYLWPGRWVTFVGRRCVLCAHRDDRLWPAEPDFPGEESMPPHLREDAGQARVSQRTARARYTNDHA